MSRETMYPNGCAKQGEWPGIAVVNAGAVLDAPGSGGCVMAAPGSVALEMEAGGERRILAAGEPEVVRKAVGDRHWVGTQRPGALIVPGMVNAHVHLDLTDVGARKFEGDFVSWVKMLQKTRDGSEAGVRAAVRRGAAMSRAAGVTTVGDIAWWRGAGWAVDELRQTGLRGVGFAEIIGLAEEYPTQPMRSLREAMGMEREMNGVRVGLQPHAPYSTAREIYERVVETAERYDLPVSTHLAEMDAEFEFVAKARGIFRGFIEELGNWREEFESKYETGMRPVEWMKGVLRRRRWLLAHCNYVDDAEIALLAACGASVAYCPRASEYFGHKGHRYREMMEAGVNVCLGTDSMVCHGTLSVVDEMRRLRQRDGMDAMTLLRMGTVNGMKGLGMDERDATLGAGSRSELVVIEGAAKGVKDAAEAWERVLGGNERLAMDVI